VSMAPQMSGAARRSIRALLASTLLLGLARAEGGIELGPALPGSDKYWVKLRGLSTSEGTMTPEFTADAT
ncbi:unnamed protein product, partial [Polarella glacialis]